MLLAEAGQAGRVRAGCAPHGEGLAGGPGAVGGSGREPGWSVRGCAGLPEVALVDLGVGRERALG